MKDYYKILDISVNATKDEIKKAFRGLAKKYHPDRNGNDKDALKKFQEVNEAYEVLSNEDSRTKYDKQRSNFKGSNKEKNEKEHNKAKNDNRKYEDREDNIDKLNKHFENFFGFNANTSDINKDKLNKKENPIDTSNMFESFFKMR